MKPSRSNIFDAVINSINTHGVGLPDYDRAKREGRFPITYEMVMESRNMSTPVFHARCLVEHIVREHCRSTCIGVDTLPTNDQLSTALYGGMPMRSLQVRRHKVLELMRENIVFRHMYITAMDALAYSGFDVKRYRTT